MESKTIPSIYLETKLLVRAFDSRKRILEQIEDLAPDVARQRVLKLAGSLIEELHLLRDRTKLGTYDNEHEPKK